MPIPKNNLIFKGALVGAITSLPVMVLSYIGQNLASYTFLPYDLFKWMTSSIPAGWLSSIIAFMVRIIALGRITPTDAVILDIEYAISILSFILTGTVFGLILEIFARVSNRYTRAWGWIGGLFLFVFFLSIETRAGMNLPSLEILLLGTTFLCLGWGWVMGQWATMETNSISDTPVPVNLSRRRFLIYVSASGLAAILSVLGILQYEQKHKGRIPSPLAQPKLPR